MDCETTERNELFRGTELSRKSVAALIEGIIAPMSADLTRTTTAIQHTERLDRRSTLRRRA